MLFIAAVVAALFLKVLPPLVVLVLFVGGVAYVNWLLKSNVKQEATAPSALLGLEHADEDRFGLLGYPFALLSRGSDARVTDVSWGRWQGVEVRAFELGYTPIGAVPERPESRAFTCAIAPADAVFPKLVVEPRAFLGVDASRAPLPEVRSADEALGRRFEVRCEDAPFVSELFDEGMVSWLVEPEQEWGFELSGRSALAYGPSDRARDVMRALQALKGFLDHVPASVRAAHPVDPI
jgi:hypothetical protein